MYEVLLRGEDCIMTLCWLSVLLCGSGNDPIMGDEKLVQQPNLRLEKHAVY